MTTLASIQKQIAALQAKAERITKQELSAAVAKVKGLMSEFGVTIEHLSQSVVGKPTAKKSTTAKTAKAQKKSASVAKYADPKSGKTWSGFGRAPGWIAGAKNRDAFLVKASVAAEKPAAAKKKAATKAAAAPAAKPAKTKATAVARPAAKKAAMPKVATAKKAPAKSVPVKKFAAKKAATKKASARKVATSAAEPAQAPTTAS